MVYGILGLIESLELNGLNTPNTNWNVRTERNGTEWNETEWNGTKRKGTETVNSFNKMKIVELQAPGKKRAVNRNFNN